VVFVFHLFCFIYFPKLSSRTLLHYKNSRVKHIFKCTFSKLLLFVGFQIIIQYQLICDLLLVYSFHWHFKKFGMSDFKGLCIWLSYCKCTVLCCF